MPTWVLDDDKWEKAKKIARSQGKTDDSEASFYVYVTGIYRKMGGRIAKSLGEESASPLVVDIEARTHENKNFRQVIHTTLNSQLVLMSLKPGEDVGEETHAGDQFIRVEAGSGQVVLNGRKRAIRDGMSISIPAGTLHNIRNTGKKPMKLYTVYSPPEHPPGTVDRVKPEAGDAA